MSSDISLSPTSLDFAAAACSCSADFQPLRRRITYILNSELILDLSVVSRTIVRAFYDYTNVRAILSSDVFRRPTNGPSPPARGRPAQPRRDPRHGRQA